MQGIDWEPFVWAVIFVGVVIIGALVVRWWNQRGPSAQSIELEDVQRSERGGNAAGPSNKCRVCRKREATHTRPRAVYARKADKRDRHASHAFGLPPRPRVSTDQVGHRMPELCLECLPTCSAELEAFLSDLYDELTSLATRQQRRAAEFEARGLFEATRKVMNGDGS